MAKLYKNGAVVARIIPGPTVTGYAYIALSFHENGHILVKKRGPGYKTYAIIPTDGIGSVVDYFLANGYVVA